MEEELSMSDSLSWCIEYLLSVKGIRVELLLRNSIASIMLVV